MASQWFVGLEHEELLEATKRQRKQRRDLEAAKVSTRPALGQGGGAIALAQIPVHEVAARVRELLADNFDDLHDAFFEIDASSTGRLSKAAFKDGLRLLGASATQLPEAGLDELFDAIDVDMQGFITLKDFLVAFEKPDYAKSRNQTGGSTGKDTVGGSLARKTGSAAKAEDREAKIKRDFDEVLMECKDERGVQKFFAIPAMASFSEVLQRLNSKYARPVTFIYEADEHQCTVKNAKDLRKCWDHVETMYRRSGSTQKAAHLDAFVVDFDASKQEALTSDNTRVELTAPRKERKAGEKESMLSKVRRGTAQRDPIASIDFAEKQKWIDDMMAALGAPAEGEPPTMQGRWDKLLAECRVIDSYGTGTVTCEGFRNGLTRTEPRMSVDQTEWFVRDADKNEAGDVMYEKYITSKRVGGLGGGGLAQDNAVTAAEMKINAALRTSFRSLQQAFRRMDADRDGRLSREEFAKGITQRLKLRLAPRIMDAVILRADFDGDGYIEYEDFLERYQRQIAGAEDGASDGMSDLEISRMLLEHHQGSVAKAFDDLDTDKDGRVSAEELFAGLKRAGLSLSHVRVDKFLSAMDLDSNRFVDYREFLRQLSKVDLSLLSTTTFDPVGREIQNVSERLRSKFDDARQAFHAFDADHDGRLSLAEFCAGVAKFSDAEQESGLLVKMFEHADRTGDGFVSYHEFLQSFGVKPKVLQSSSRDKAIREFLKKQFPGSITAAFQALDLDNDQRLSKEDLRDGLRRLGMPIQDHEADALMRRADFDQDQHVDYLEFLVRFGLESKAEGKWEYKFTDAASGVAKDVEAAKPFRRGVSPSRWHGRGGVAATLLRFDTNKDGKLTRKEFENALRDGLGFDALTPEALEGITGVNFDRAFCDPKRCLLDVAQFVQLFVDVFCQLELEMFSALLVQNRWLDLLKAFQSFGSAGTAERPLISKADFSAALQRLVDKNMIQASERTSIIAKAVEDQRFEQSGKMVGYIDYLNNFLRFYIGEEMQIHAAVSPVWEDWVRRLEHFGGTITHAQFRELCGSVALQDGREALSSAQIEWLIDVIDADGDGTVSKTELVRRYARDDAVLMSVMKHHWLDILTTLESARRPGNTSKAIPRTDMQTTLLKLCEMKQMGDLTKDQVTEVVGRIDETLVTSSGDILYEAWIQKYANSYYSIHKGFQGLDSSTKLPKWDSVISWFEVLDGSRGAAGQRHLVSWDHFRKVLVRAGIELDSNQVSQLIEHLDPNLTGHIQWVNFVCGSPLQDLNSVGVADADTAAAATKNNTKSRAPYFFNGEVDLQARTLMRTYWDEVLASCRRAVARLRASAPLLQPAGTQCLLPCAELAAALRDCEKLKLGDAAAAVGQGRPPSKREREHAVVKKICDMAAVAFSVAVRDAKGQALVDCEAMVKYYAGQKFYAEGLFERKWEHVISVMQQMDVRKDGKIPRDGLERRLLSPELGLTHSMVEYMMQGENGGEVDYQEMCWRCGRPTILKMLAGKWSTLMRGWRAADKLGEQRLDPASFRAVLDRVDVGLGHVQVVMLLRHVLVEEDGRIDYHKVLSGRLADCVYPADAYVGWRVLEEHWERISDNFTAIDVNADGKVTHQEFRASIQQLRIPGLTEAKVFDAILREVDPEGSGVVMFEHVTWAMLREGLKESVGGSAADILEAYRAKAASLFGVHAGTLPFKEVAQLVEDVVCKRHGIRRAHSNLVAVRSADKDGIVSEAGLLGVLNELSGEPLGKADTVRLRDDLMYMQAAATVVEPDTWVSANSDRHHGLHEYSGVCVLSGAALGCVGKMPYSRGHMRYFFADGGKSLVQSMVGSAKLQAIKQERAEKVYGSTPWIKFWQTRSQYTSPAFADRENAPTHVGMPAMKKYQKKLSQTPKKGAAGKKVLDAAVGKIKKHLMDVQSSRDEAKAYMDQDGRGVTTSQLFRGWLTQTCVGLSGEEADAVVRDEDPNADGVILYEAVLDRYDYGASKVDFKKSKENRSMRSTGSTHKEAVTGTRGVSSSSRGGGLGGALPERGGVAESLEQMYRDTAEQLRQLAGLRELDRNRSNQYRWV